MIETPDWPLFAVALSMSSGWSVILVGNDGDEVPVPVDVFSTGLFSTCPYFPDDGVVTRQGLCKIRSGWLVAHGQEFKMTAPWLTQTHLDYLTLKQELYGPEAVLTVRMQKLLATLITASKERPVYRGLKLSEGIGCMTCTSDEDLLVHLQMQDSAMEKSTKTQKPASCCKPGV